MKKYPHSPQNTPQKSRRVHYLRLGAIIAAVSALGMLSACSTTATTSTATKIPAVVVVVPPPVIVDGHTTRNSVDWEGYYTGTIPCASCSGINVWLNLKSAGNTTRYTLVENYLGNKASSFRSSGNAVWRSNGSVIDLKGKDENRALFIGENFAEFIGADQKQASGRSDYTLHKADSFVGDQWHLLVDPRQVRTERRNGKTWVRFPGLLNYSKIAQGGHQSLTGTYVIDCAKKQYDMPTVKYYEKPFAAGKLIAQSAHNSGNWLPTQNGGVFRQAAEQYCR